MFSAAGLPAAGLPAGGSPGGGFHGGGLPQGRVPRRRVSRRRVSRRAGLPAAGFHGGGLPQGRVPRRRASRRRASRRRASTAAGFPAAGFPAAGFHGGGLPRRRASTAAGFHGGGAACLCGARCAPPPQATIKMLDFLSFPYRFHCPVYTAHSPPCNSFPCAAATDVFAAQISHQEHRRERDTGHGNFRLQGSRGFRFWTDRRLGFGPPGLNGSGLWFFFRHVPSCRKGKKATVPCDAALPCRAKGAAGVRIRRCLLCGQRRFKVARRIMAGSREKVFCGAVCPSGNFPGAPGDVGTGFSPQGAEFFPHTVSSTPSQRAFPRKKRRYAPSHRRNAPLPPKNLPHLYLSIRSKRGPLQAAPHLSRFAANIQRTPKPSFPRFKSLQQSARHPPSVLRLAVCPIGMIAPLPSISSQLPADR